VSHIYTVVHTVKAIHALVNSGIPPLNAAEKNLTQVIAEQRLNEGTDGAAAPGRSSLGGARLGAKRREEKFVRYFVRPVHFR